MRTWMYHATALVLLALLALLPRRACLALGRGLGRLAFRLVGERAQVAEDNLALVYGHELDARRRHRLARANFAHLGGALCETLWAAARPRAIPRFVQVAGEEHARRALEQGNGLVLVSAHLGNFLMLPSALNGLGDVKFLFREPSDRSLETVYARLRARLGMGVIADNPRQVCAFRSFQHLKRGGILGVLIDQVETGGLYVDFMGHPAGSTLGAAQLALKSGAPLVPVFCARQADGRLRVTLEPELEIRRDGESDTLLREAVTRMNQVVERWVRAHPEQWFWGHRRWRTWRK